MIELKMKKLIISFTIVLSFSVISCEKDNGIIEDNNSSIVGEWIWLKSYGGFTGGDIQTPEQNGIEKIVKFYNNDTVEIFENEVLIHKTDYFLSREESILLNDTFDFLTINYKYWIINPDSIITLPMRYIIRDLSDTLMLDEDVYDGYGHLYKRMN